MKFLYMFIFIFILVFIGCGHGQRYVRFDTALQCETKCNGAGKVKMSSKDVDHMDLSKVKPEGK